MSTKRELDCSSSDECKKNLCGQFDHVMLPKYNMTVGERSRARNAITREVFDYFNESRIREAALERSNVSNEEKTKEYERIFEQWKHDVERAEREYASKYSVGRQKD